MQHPQYWNIFLFHFCVREEVAETKNNDGTSSREGIDWEALTLEQQQRQPRRVRGSLGILRKPQLELGRIFQSISLDSFTLLSSGTTSRQRAIGDKCQLESLWRCFCGGNLQQDHRTHLQRSGRHHLQPVGHISNRSGSQPNHHPSFSFSSKSIKRFKCHFPKHTKHLFYNMAHLFTR